MVKLANILNRLSPCKVLVVGDMLLDSYTLGKAKRISPEAPVAVVEVIQQNHQPGGAGNVILNLLSLRAEVIAIGRVGQDWAGSTFIDVLQKEGTNVDLIVYQNDFQTPIKNRVIADNQQIVRIDYEKIIPLEMDLENYIIDHLSKSFDGVQIVAISDYGKGFLTPRLLHALISKAKEMNIPVITDPKGHDFQKYKGTTIIKPNLSESYAAAKLPMHAPLETVASLVLAQCEASLLMVTRSEAGIALFDNHGNQYDFPVQAKDVKDVTGAGDTVLAMLSLALGNGLTYSEAAQLCNIAAGIAIEHVGCARVSLSDIALRLHEFNMGNKVFDQENIYVLNEILKNGSYSLLLLTETNEFAFTYSVYQAIISMTKEQESLLIYVECNTASQPFIDILSSLLEVNFIVVDLPSLKNLCSASPPNKVYKYDSSHQLYEDDWDAFISQNLIEEIFVIT